MAKKRKPSTSVFIACEGSNTEPLYFEKLKEVMEDEDDYPYAVTVYPNKEFDENPKTDALGLIHVAVERSHEFDELWVVFDKDGYTKHKEAFELAKKRNINIAFSSISFETWVLLHFERSNTVFEKSANIIRDKFHGNDKHLITYAKSGDYSVYPHLENRTTEAFKNASWLRNWLSSIDPKYTVYEANPYTDVDFLVKKLLLNDAVYEFSVLGQSIDFENIEIVVSNANDEYIVKIVNSTDRSLVLNEFGFYNVEMNRIALPNAVIYDGNFIEFSLCQIAENPIIFMEFKNLKLEVSGLSA